MSFAGKRKHIMITPTSEETSWEVLNLISSEGTLSLKITIQSGKEVDNVSKLSPKYTINDAVRFQMRMDTGLACIQPCVFEPLSRTCLNFSTYTLFCMFENVKGSDMSYMADVSLKGFMKNCKKTFHVHDQTWRLLVEPTTFNLTTVFNITVTLSLTDQIIRPFAQLYEDSKTTDLRLIGKDGTVELHSATLIAYSSIFNKKICEKAQESSRPYELELPNVKHSTLQHLKDYIYLNNLPESPLSSLTNLINFASEYNMRELSQICTQKLSTIAGAENFYELTHYALNNNMIDFFLDILELIENGKIKTEDIKKLAFASESSAQKNI